MFRTPTVPRRVAIRSIAALLVSATLVACASGESASSGPSDTGAPSDTGGPSDTGAPSTGDLTVYSGRSLELVEPILDRFTEETGISVGLRPGDSGELAAQLLTEGDASPADVFFSQDAGALGAVSDAGLFATLPDDLVSVVPTELRSTENLWVGTSGRVRVFVINPELVPDPPTTIDELLDPQWKGAIGFAPNNASWQSFVTGLRVLRGEDGARAWLEGFAAQDPVPFENNVAVRDAVDAGDLGIGLVNHYYLYEKIATEGADAVTAVNQFLAAGDPGGLLNVAGVGVLASSKNSDEALQLVAFLLGETAQRYFADETFEYPVSAGIAASALLPSLDTLEPPTIDLSDLDSIAETQELLSDVGLLTR